MTARKDLVTFFLSFFLASAILGASLWAGVLLEYTLTPICSSNSFYPAKLLEQF